MKDNGFDKTMNKVETDAWIGFKVVASQFLDNKRDQIMKRL